MAVQISGNDITVPRDTTVTRNLTVGGVLTYEDVTNVDSVGLITARSGIEIGASPGVAASISVDGNMIVSGISTFGGDVQVPDKIIHAGDTNTALRFPAADTITAETAGSERLRISSAGVIQCGTSGVLKAEINNAVSGHQFISQCDDNNNGFEVYQKHGSSTSRNTFAVYANTGASSAKELHFAVRGDGNVGIGTDAPAQAVHINKSSGDSYLRIQGGTNQGTLINKTDGTLIGGFVSGGAVGGSVNDIAVRTETGNNILFAHGTTERLRVTSDGYLQQHKLVAVSYSDTRELALNDVELTTSNFYNHTNFASDNSILDSNGHFVAPVHGIYRLFCRFSSDSSTGNRINVRLRKNGNTINEAYSSNESQSVIQSTSSEIIAELDANEYFDIQVAQLHTMSGAQHKVVNFHMLG